MFQKGNEFWRIAENFKRPPFFESPQELAEVAQRYFQWATDNPIMESGIYGKDPVEMELPKMRAFTVQGLCNFANMSTTTWYNLRRNKAYIDIISRIESIMYQQKFEGAACGQLNPNIIARDLGLVDKKMTEVTNAQKVVLYVPDNNRKIIAPPPTIELSEGEDFDLLAPPNTQEED